MPEDQEYESEETEEAEGEGERYVRMTRADIRKLEKSGEKASKLEADNAEMARKLAFLEAGVDTTSKVGQLLMKGWDGELDVEAIKAEAAEVGALKTDTPAKEPVTTEAGEEGSSDERASLGAGANVDQFRTGDPDPQEEAIKTGRKVMEAGGTEEDSLGAAFDVLAKAGVAGDKRALWDPNG